LVEFCQQNYITKLSLFGSVLNDTFRIESDIDVVEEFEPEHVPGFAFFRMQDELSVIFGGRKVDLYTPKWLGDEIYPQVQSEMLVIYTKDIN